MGEENTPPADPQAGNTGDPQPQAGDGNEQISLAEARKLRSEAQNLRKRLQEFEALNTELKTFKERTESEKLTDTEKREAAQKKLEQLLSEHQNSNNSLLRELQEQRVANEVFKHASKLNIIDLDAAVKLLDSSQIEYDDDGRPKNIDALLKDLVKQRSWLVGKAPTPTSGGATNPSRSQTSGPQQITKEYVAQVMKGGPEAWNALSKEEQLRISEFVRNGGTIIRR